MAENKQNKRPNVPPLRFPEFTDEWIETSIGSVLSIGNGRDYKDLGHGDVPVFGTGGYMTSVNKCLLDGESVFIGRKGTINKPFYFNGKFWTVDTLFYTHSFKGILPKFVLSIFENIDWLKYNEASGVPSLSKSSIEKIKICIPKIIEQQKISDFIDLLNHRIEFQSKIIEDLRQLRSALTNKFIEKLVATCLLIPFSDIYETAGEGGTPDTTKSEYYERGTIPFIKIDDLSNKYLQENKDFITELGLKKSSAWVVPKQSVIFSNGATIGAISINTYDVTTKQGILGIVPKATVDVEFLYYLMSSTYFTKQIHRIITHGTMATAYLKDINKIKVPLPIIKEQKRIVKILSSISRKQEIEEQILNQLKIQKQYLLGQMFI